MAKGEKEKLIAWADVPMHIPGFRPTIQTIDRWRRIGVRGRKLTSLMIGGKRFCTPEMIADFLRQPEWEPALCR